jgi:hypothetical protein
MGIITEPSSATLRPGRDARLKMHLRLLNLAGITYRVVTLRPAAKVSFSTNFFHDTWHIITSQWGAQLLARLLWGLSFQRRPGTLLLVHGDHLLPTPFEGDRSVPFLVAPANLTRLDPAALRTLKTCQSRLGPPACTIRWHTFGLDLALEQGVLPEAEKLHLPANWQPWQQERMERRGGFICYTAPPPILRAQAMRVHDLRVRQGSYACEMDYHFLAEATSRGSGYADGEGQIFLEYLNLVAAAVQARGALVPNQNQPTIPEAVQAAIVQRRDHIVRRRRAARR